MALDPPPPPAEKHMRYFIVAQTRRINIQAGEIKDLWKEVKDLHGQKFDADAKAKELTQKYSQLRLEAWLGLTRIAIIVVAVTFVLWVKFDKLPEVLRALPRTEFQPTAAAVKETNVSPPVAAKAKK